MQNLSPHSFDMARHEERLDRLISESYSSSFMSNSKWRRLFLALADAGFGDGRLLWKFVGRAEPVLGAAPGAECLGKSYITRTSFAAFPYKEIEWIEVPGLAELPASVLEVGQFEALAVPTGIRLLGYR